MVKDKFPVTPAVRGLFYQKLFKVQGNSPLEAETS